MTTIKLSENVHLEIFDDGEALLVKEPVNPFNDSTVVIKLTRDETEALRMALNEADDTRKPKRTEPIIYDGELHAKLAPILHPHLKP
jgi:hypothetical protein